MSAVVVLDSNRLIALVCRQQPSLDGLVFVKFENNCVLKFIPLCWFPPNLPVVKLAVSIDSSLGVRMDAFFFSKLVLLCYEGRLDNLLTVLSNFEAA